MSTPTAVTATIAGRPTPVPLTPGVLSAVQAALMPAQPMPPSPPKPTRVTAVQAVNCVDHVADQVIENLYVRRKGRTNIVIQNCKGDVTVRNVVSVGSKPIDPSGDQFGGQGVYADTIGGTLTIEDSLIAWSGVAMPDDPPGDYCTPTMFRHDLYINDGVGGLVVQRCILGPAANAGIQSRVLKGPSIITDNLILDCGTALLLIEGGATVENNVIYGGSYYFDGSNWTGGSAIKSYWQALLNKNTIVLRPNQGAFPASPTHPASSGARLFPQAMIDVGGEWVHQNPAWSKPPGWPNIAEYLSGAANACPASWPGLLCKGPTKMQGWAAGPRIVDFDYRPAMLACAAGGSVADARAAIAAGLGIK